MRVIMLVLMLLANFGGLARAAELGTSDKAAIASVINQQLDAFAADDFARAYSFAAPVVQMVFPTVEQFSAMVRNGYAPVYRNTGRNFGETFTDPSGRPAMRVGLTGADGQRYEAVYAMERQPNGTWKIAGCSIIRIEGSEV